MIDWAIRNSDWLVTVLFTLLLGVWIYRRFLQDLLQDLKRRVQKHVQLPTNIDFANGGLPGILSDGGKENFLLAIVSYFTLLLRKLILDFVDSALFKTFVALLLVLFLGVLIYYPVALATDLRSFKTAALDFPDPLCENDDHSKLLVFIHGWNGDDASSWLKFPELVCGDDRLNAFEAISIHYPTYIESRHLGIAELADWVDEKLKIEIANLDDIEITVIAHSMGGLVAKELVVLQKLADKDTIRKLITIGSPHNGAEMANLLTALKIEDEFIEDMTESSVYLDGLHSKWNKIADRPRVHCFSSPRDIVVKQSSAFFQCDTQFSYPQWSHSEMVKPEGIRDDRYQFPIWHVVND